MCKMIHGDLIMPSMFFIAYVQKEKHQTLAKNYVLSHKKLESKSPGGLVVVLIGSLNYLLMTLASYYTFHRRMFKVNS